MPGFLSRRCSATPRPSVLFLRAGRLSPCTSILTRRFPPTGIPDETLSFGGHPRGSMDPIFFRFHHLYRHSGRERSSFSPFTRRLGQAARFSVHGVHPSSSRWETTPSIRPSPNLQFSEREEQRSHGTPISNRTARMSDLSPGINHKVGK